MYNETQDEQTLIAALSCRWTFEMSSATETFRLRQTMLQRKALTKTLKKNCRISWPRYSRSKLSESFTTKLPTIELVLALPAKLRVSTQIWQKTWLQTKRLWRTSPSMQISFCTPGNKWSWEQERDGIDYIRWSSEKTAKMNRSQKFFII